MTALYIEVPTYYLAYFTAAVRDEMINPFKYITILCY